MTTGSGLPGAGGIARFRPMLALVATAALWGTATTGTKYALGGFGPMTLLLIEFAAANVLLWPVVLRHGYRPPRSWRVVATLGLLEVAVNVADTWGLSITRASSASIIYGLESVFVVVLARFFLRELINRWTAMAATLALAGLIALGGGFQLDDLGSGDLIITLGVVCAAAYTVSAKAFGDSGESGRPGEAVNLAAHLFAVGGVPVLAIAITRWSTGAEPVPVAVPPAYWLAAIAVGLGGLCLSLLLYNYGISQVRAGSAGLIVNLSPIFGLIAAVAVLSEVITVAIGVGALLVGASAVIVARSEHRRPNGRAVDQLSQEPEVDTVDVIPPEVAAV